jgi:hypothetical protein
LGRFGTKSSKRTKYVASLNREIATQSLMFLFLVRSSMKGFAAQKSAADKKSLQMNNINAYPQFALPQMPAL